MSPLVAVTLVLSMVCATNGLILLKDEYVTCTSTGVYFNLKSEFDGKVDPELKVQGTVDAACATSDGLLNVTFGACGVDLGKVFQVKVSEGLVESATTTAVYNVSCVDAVGSTTGGIEYNVTTVINKVAGELNATDGKVGGTVPPPDVEMKILSGDKMVSGEEVVINTPLKLQIEIKSATPDKYKVTPGSCQVYNGDKKLQLTENGCSKLSNVFGDFQQVGPITTATFNAFRIRNAQSDVVTYTCTVYVCSKDDITNKCKAITCGTAALFNSVERFRRAPTAQTKEEVLQFIKVVDAKPRSAPQNSVCLEQHYFILLVVLLVILLLVSTITAVVMACQSRSRKNEMRKLEFSEMSGRNNAGFIPRVQVSHS